MARYQIGDRVGAIFAADQTAVRLLGYGTYQGEEVPPPGVKLMGLDMNALGHTNPKILLDNGQVVWGCECWWGPETRIKESIGNRQIVPVDIEVERTKGGA